MVVSTLHKQLREKYNPDGSALRELQLNLISILVEFDQFAREHNLSYSISFGTLIGAIRHHGFIPWDDDADIMLSREEWNELKKHIKSDNHLTESITIEGIVRPELHVKNKGIIDIFIMDYAPENIVLDKMKGWVCMLILLLLKCKSRIKHRYYGHFKIWFLLFPIAYFFPVKILIKWKDIVSMWFTPKEIKFTDNVRLYNGDPKALNMKHQYGVVLGEKIDVDFEGHKLKAIPKYDEFLRIWYGDYMLIPKLPENLGRVADCDFYDNKVKIIK